MILGEFPSRKLSSSVVYFRLANLLSSSHLAEDKSDVPEEVGRSHKDIKDSESITVKEPTLPENGLENGKRQQVSVDDVLCVVCKELLFQPAVLNCGHGWNFY